MTDILDRAPTRALNFTFTETGYIGTSTFVSDAGGGGTETQTWGAGIPCRIDALGGGEREQAAKIADASTHLVSLPAGTQVSADNDFMIDNRGTFEITAVRQNTNELTRQVEVVARS